MAPRVSPTEAIRAQIDELFSTDGDLLSVLEQVARLSGTAHFPKRRRRGRLRRSSAVTVTSAAAKRPRRATATAGSRPAR